MYREVLDALRVVPGVESVAMTASLPFSDMGVDSSPIEIHGAPDLPDGQHRHAAAIPVSPDFFRTLGIPM